MHNSSQNGRSIGELYTYTYFKNLKYSSMSLDLSGTDIGNPLVSYIRIRVEVSSVIRSTYNLYGDIEGTTRKYGSCFYNRRAVKLASMPDALLLAISDIAQMMKDMAGCFLLIDADYIKEYYLEETGKQKLSQEETPPIGI